MQLSQFLQPLLAFLGLTSQLQTDHFISSAAGLNSVSTLITGSNSAVLIDPSWFLTDAADCAEWIKSKIGNKELSAIFVTHFHPDHYMGANAILEAFPEARFYASLQTVEAINNEAWRTKEWIKMFGPEKIPAEPRVPEVFNHTFFTLEGDDSSPIHLLSPLQGDTIDHTMFWLPTERVIVAGDTVYGRTFPLYLEEAATSALATAWENSLLCSPPPISDPTVVIKSLNPSKVIPGHVAPGIVLDGHTDLDHSLRYLQYFRKHVLAHDGELPPKHIFEILQREFPDTVGNLDFILNRTAENFGKDGIKWPENDSQDLKSRLAEQLDAYILRIKGIVGKMSGLSLHDEL